MKKYTLISLASVLVATLLFSVSTSAATINYNDIISDPVFDNAGSMSVAQINNFLNTFPNSCISTNNGFSSPKPTGYSPSNSFTYGSLESAGNVIYDAAQAYGINPQVIIATLQKEQGLIDGSGSNVVRTSGRPGDCGALAISASMGYNCPDSMVLTSYSGFTMYAYKGVPVTSVTKTCVQSASYVGFTRQVINAAWHLTFDRHRSEGQNNWYISKPGWDNSDDLNFCYSGPMTQGTFAVCPSGSATYYDGYKTIDSTSIHMDDGATAALYHYTPHLNGQLLFFNSFTAWFGSTFYTVKGAIGDKYNQLGGANGSLGDPLMNERCGLAQGGCYQKFSNGYIYWTSSTGAWMIHGGIFGKWATFGYEHSFLGYPTTDEISIPGGVYQQFQNGKIFWTSSTGANDVHGGIMQRYDAIGDSQGSLGYPTSGEIGIPGGVYQQYQNGRIYWSSGTNAWDISGDFLTKYQAVGAQSGLLGFPTSGVSPAANGAKVQAFQGGRLYLSSGGNIYLVHGGIYGRYSAIGYDGSALGSPTSDEIGVPGGVYQQFQNGRIYWSSSNNAWDLSGQALTYYLANGAEQGYLGFPTNVQPIQDGWVATDFQGGTTYSGSDSVWLVHGANRSQYNRLGGSGGYLGLPTSNEIAVPGGVYQRFQGGQLYWSSSSGSHDVHGAILGRYDQLNNSQSFLGFPTSSENRIRGGVYQQYQGGRIYWSGPTNAYAVHGGIQSKYLSLGAENGRLGYPTSGEIADGPNGAVRQDFQHGTIYWNPSRTSVSYR